MESIGVSPLKFSGYFSSVWGRISSWQRVMWLSSHNKWATPWCLSSCCIILELLVCFDVCLVESKVGRCRGYGSLSPKPSAHSLTVLWHWFITWQPENADKYEASEQAANEDHLRPQSHISWSQWVRCSLIGLRYADTVDLFIHLLSRRLFSITVCQTQGLMCEWQLYITFTDNH